MRGSCSQELHAALHLFFDFAFATEATHGVVSNDVFYRFTYVYEATGVFKELGVAVIPGDELEVAVNNADTLSNIFQRCLELFPTHGKGVRCFAGEKSKILELDLLAAQ